MPAYLIVRCRITDPEQFAAYARRAAELTERYGGRYIVRGGPVEPMEGQMGEGAWVVSEWPSAEHARRFWESDDYAEAKALRARNAVADVILLEGVADDG